MTSNSLLGTEDTMQPIGHTQNSFVLVFQKTKYHRSQSLGYKNGYRIPNRPSVGIGGEPIPFNGLSEQELDELANFEPTLTYGQAKQAPPSDFVPAHVFWDKKVCQIEIYIDLKFRLK